LSTSFPNPFATVDTIKSQSWSLALDSSVGNIVGNGIGQIVQGYDDIHQCIKIIFGTIPGQDPFRPTFGCDLTAFMDVPISVAIPAIVATVTDAITNWEPRITIDSIQAQYSLSVPGQLLINILWHPNLGQNGLNKTAIGQQSTLLQVGGQPKTSNLLTPALTPPPALTLRLPVNFWPMNEGNGANFLDYEGMAPMIAHNVTWQYWAGFGTVATFNGANSYAQPGAFVPSLNFSGTTPFSVSFWMNTVSVAANQTQVVIGNLDVGNQYQGWEIAFGADSMGHGVLGLSLIKFDNTYQMNVDTLNLPVGSNVFVTITYDGSEIPGGVLVYFNGVFVPSYSPIYTLTPGTVLNSTATVAIGGKGDGTMNGALCFMRVWDVQLTPSEVAILFGRGVQ
jgi:phage baseplate assembly protein W